MSKKQEDVVNRLLKIANEFNDQNDPVLYFPRQCQRIIRFLSNNGRVRGNWISNLPGVITALRQLADEILKKNVADSKLMWLGLMRTAKMLEGYTGGDLVIAGDIDQKHWEDGNFHPDVIARDYERVKRGEYVTDIALLYQEGDAQQQSQTPQPVATGAPVPITGNNPPPQETASPIVSASGGRDWKQLGKIVVISAIIGLVIAAIAWSLWGDQASQLIWGDQPSAQNTPVVPDSNPGVDLTPDGPSGFEEALQRAQEAAGVTSQPEVGPEGNLLPEGAPISSPLQTIQQSMLLGVAVLTQVVFWILAILSIFQAYQVFKDSRARASEGDFTAFLRLMGVIALLAVIPVKAVVQIDLTIWRWYFPMPTSYNLVLLLVAGSGLWGIAQDRMTEELDLTPLSAGLFIVGTIFFATNAVAFLSWQIPLETYIAWGAALITHLIELVRQEDTKEALILTGAGIAIQLVVFFGFSWALGTTASPFFLNYGQEISFLLSVFLSVGLISFGLNILSKQELLPAGGQMLMHVETSSHDAGLMLIMWAVIFMSQYWV